ncbi:MAG: hypothetical protein AB1941_27990 [Gemmatimonadota bacterium]
MSAFERDHRRVQAALAALAGPDGHALLAHLRECPECARALEGVQDALLAALYLPPPHAMDAARHDTVRERLLARASGAAPDASAPPARRPLALAGGVGGWMVAAGLATLLLTHHAFHRPVQFGWVVASVLGAVLFGAALYLLGERRRSERLRERLAALEQELTRIRAHAMGSGQALGTA